MADPGWVGASLDNVSYVGWADDELLQAVRSGLLTTEGRTGTTTPAGAPLVVKEVYNARCPWRPSFLLADGSHLTFTLRQGAPRASLTIEEPNVRLELNPNKADNATLSICGRIGLDHVTRCDVAVDYPGLRAYEWFAWSPRGCRMDVSNAAGRHQTTQIGRRGSRRHLVVYDKGAELGLSDDLLRVEARTRHRPSDTSGVLAATMFDGLQMVGRSIPQGLTPMESAWCALAIHDPGLFRRADRKTRVRVLGLLDGSLKLEPAPADVYCSQRERLLDELGDMLAGRSFGLMAEVYARKGEDDGRNRVRSGSA